jgi:GT2 family glycosyltransferase
MMDKQAVGSANPTDAGHSAEHVVVAITTRERPGMLANCLTKCLAAESPPAALVRVVVVDNDPAESGRAVVAEVAAASGARVDYVVEPQPGIPAVRNRVLEVAAGMQAKWLAFIDDDSLPDPRWLVALIGALRREGAQLAGGPIIFGAPQEAVGAWRSFICRGLVASSRRRLWWRARQGRASADKTVITTANWCADLPWLVEQGLRFDDRYARSGGEDTAMDRAMRLKGAKVVYEPASLVTEIVPAERLTLGYQFGRRMHAGMVRGHQRRGERRSGPALPRAIALGALSLVGAGFLFPAGILAALASPALGAQLAIGAARMAGRGVGFVRGVLGELPQQYRKVQGY